MDLGGASQFGCCDAFIPRSVLLKIAKFKGLLVIIVAFWMENLFTKVPTSLNLSFLSIVAETVN